MFFALLLMSPIGSATTHFAESIPLMIAMSLVATGVSFQLGLNAIKLNAYEIRGVTRTAVFAVVTGLTGAALNIFLDPQLLPGVFTIFSLIFLVTAVAWRIALRHVTTWIYRNNRSRMRVLVYGAGQTGQQLIAALRTDDAIVPVAFVDDNPTLQSTTILGLRVYAPSSIKELIADKKIDRVVLAMPSLGQPRQARIAHGLRELGCQVHALPSFADLVSSSDLAGRTAAVDLDDLLGRGRLESELPSVSHAYSGRNILITGAGGSIGSELCRQLIACRPNRLVILDHSELNLYNIDKELRDIANGIKIVPVLGSVNDKDMVRQTLSDNTIDVVLHAAAYKHVPMVQLNPIVGLNNNVFGTKTVADAAREAGVERFILVSSDKAVRPTNVMGASKRLAELVVQDLSTRSKNTRFSMVRFGNVLGSSGSVIPLFKEQIARGGPVTLTHGEVTRYFMTISEAARLVLLAGSFARGGDVFVLDMGDPVPIKKLARQMIEGAGFSVKDSSNPSGDIEIKVTGLRPGEKLHEELLISSDMLTTPHNKILRAQEHYLSELEIANALKDLRRAVEQRDEDGAMQVIGRWVESSEDETSVQMA
nr:nucleoside-diphosphate sugar epimerase/dehydratase [Pseudoprimorskyibacter insulae]